jgi:hypothetical protein
MRERELSTDYSGLSTTVHTTEEQIHFLVDIGSAFFFPGQKTKETNFKISYSSRVVSGTSSLFILMQEHESSTDCCVFSKCSATTRQIHLLVNNNNHPDLCPSTVVESSKG